MTVQINGTSGLVFNDASTQNTAATGFGFKNRIINGSMMIDQRNAGASVALSGSSRYPVDRFVCFYTNSGGAATGQQSSVAPAGFTNSLLYSVTTGAAIGTGDYSCIQQSIEGFNAADLGWGTSDASTVTLSFWVRSSLTGTFSGSLNNAGPSRSYVYTYTINTANTWEYKTITITGDTSGTWGKTNGVGIYVYWNMGFQSPSTTSTTNAWVAGAFNGATGAVTPSTTTGATFYITGVQLEKGSTATSFDYRPYGTELALCQRYCYRYLGSTSYEATPLNGFAYNSSIYYATYAYPVPMRATPTLSYLNLRIDNYTAGYSVASASLDSASSARAVFFAATASGTPLTQYRGYAILADATTTAYLILSAEL